MICTTVSFDWDFLLPAILGLFFIGFFVGRWTKRKQAGIPRDERGEIIWPRIKVSVDAVDSLRDTNQLANQIKNLSEELKQEESGISDRRGPGGNYAPPKPLKPNGHNAHAIRGMKLNQATKNESITQLRQRLNSLTAEYNELSRQGRQLYVAVPQKRKDYLRNQLSALQEEVRWLSKSEDHQVIGTYLFNRIKHILNELKQRN